MEKRKRNKKKVVNVSQTPIKGLYIPWKEYAKAIQALTLLPEWVKAEDACLEDKPFKKNKLAEKVIRSFKQSPAIKIVSKIEKPFQDKAAATYTWWDDTIRVHKPIFYSRARYAVIAHELVHSVGFPYRKFRRCLYQVRKDTKHRAKEELIAEFGAFIFCALVKELDKDALNYFAVKLEHYMRYKARYYPKLSISEVIRIAIRSVDYIFKN